MRNGCPQASPWWKGPWFPRSQASSALPPQPENCSLFSGRCRTSVHSVPKSRPRKPSSPWCPLSGREVKGRLRLSHTYIRQRNPPSQTLSNPQPGPLTTVYALEVGKEPKSHKTRFFTKFFVTFTYGLKQGFTTWVDVEITGAVLESTNTWAPAPGSHLIGLGCGLALGFIKTLQAVPVSVHRWEPVS